MRGIITDTGDDAIFLSPSHTTEAQAGEGMPVEVSEMSYYDFLYISFFTTFFIIKNVCKTSFYNTRRPFVLNPIALTFVGSAIIILGNRAKVPSNEVSMLVYHEHPIPQKPGTAQGYKGQNLYYSRCIKDFRPF